MTADLRTRVSSGGELVVCDDAYPGLPPRLRGEVADRFGRSSATGAGSLNQGGWKSDSLLLWSTPAALELLATLRDLLTAREIDAWAMVNWAGSHHPRHVHQGVSVAGIYYVAPGDDQASGSPTPTVFEFPDGSEVHVTPVPGRLAVFPGRLPHWVPTYLGDAPRVTVAFNVTG